jgi:hypothetical protein
MTCGCAPCGHELGDERRVLELRDGAVAGHTSTAVGVFSKKIWREDGIGVFNDVRTNELPRTCTQACTQLNAWAFSPFRSLDNLLKSLARPKRFELLTPRFVV